ncbi:MAG: class I SAM-dependent methyltransferase family protein [Candidatus Bathyarchaeota archaeon]|nr:class I SAM-dependent methyltransferase family protein [Candidatus Bathyarchaeota archaeon]
MPKEAVCLKIPKAEGQKTLDLANRLGLTDKTLQIQSCSQGFLCIPLKREPTEKEQTDLKRQLTEAQFSVQVFAEKRQREKTLSEALAGKLPPQLLSSLPRAFDAVGDIAIVEIPPELEAYKGAVGEAVLQTHKNMQVVLAKAGKVSGTFRLRDFEFIAGKHRTSTMYKEYGCSYYVDVAKAYFSPRLGHEHQRVAELVEEGETVVDLFAGVGPFAVPIAKNRKNVKVYAVDINADAVQLLEKNARLNRVEGRVHPMVGDARQVVSEKLSGVADRVIMNLPETASAFIDVACKAVKPCGGVVHFYGFMRAPETLEDQKKLFSKAVADAGRRVEDFTCAKAVRETAPYEYQIVLDAVVR